MRESLLNSIIASGIKLCDFASDTCRCARYAGFVQRLCKGEAFPKLSNMPSCRPGWARASKEICCQDGTAIPTTCRHRDNVKLLVIRGLMRSRMCSCVAADVDSQLRGRAGVLARRPWTAMHCSGATRCRSELHEPCMPCNFTRTRPSLDGSQSSAFTAVLLRPFHS